MPTELAHAFEGATTYWTYEPSRPPLRTVIWRTLRRLQRKAAPTWQLVSQPEAKGPWVMYFLYLPDGQLQAYHRFTLERLSREKARLMLVCTCPPDHPVLQELQTRCDALCWKSLEGYDFSAYGIGLTELAAHVPGTDVLVLNDSVMGPFAPLTPFIEQAPWPLTGFTGNAQEENHIQSYAFVVRCLTPKFLEQLSAVLSTRWCFNRIEPVILLQETLMAREASRHMNVGAYWFAQAGKIDDLCLRSPEQMIEAGFPFIKRSLFGKFAGSFQDPEKMQALLRQLGHPDMN